MFGAIRSQTGSSANEFKFTGEQVDSTNLQYLRARYYDPATGRFLGRDPAEAGHAYAYAENNPVNFVDPSGLCDVGLFDPPIPCPPSPPDPRDVVNPAIDLLPDYLVKEMMGFHLSAELLATCALYPEKCTVAAGLSLLAQKETERLYGKGGREGTRAQPKEGDAFQHCFWAGLLTIFIDSDFADDFTRRYESWPGNSEDQKQYDLDNDKRGRQFSQISSASPLGPLASIALHEYCRGG